MRLWVWLRSNWIWWAVPVAVIVALMIAVILLTEGDIGVPRVYSFF